MFFFNKLIDNLGNNAGILVQFTHNFMKMGPRAVWARKEQLGARSLVSKANGRKEATCAKGLRLPVH